MIKTLLVVGVISLAAVVFASCRSSAAELPATGAKSPLDFTLKANDGSDYPLANLKGKVVMLVNTASKCGYTKQYAGLQKLYATYADRGLVIVGIPSNDFLSQEPGTDGDIKEFCQRNFGVTFPLMAKVAVKGEAQVPLYRYLTAESPFPGKISWNFNKFLIGRDGQLVSRYGSNTAPDDADFIKAIEAALAANVSPASEAAPKSTGTQETK